MFSILCKIIPVTSPSGFSAIRLQGLLHKQEIQIGQIEHVHVIPMCLSLVNHEPLTAGQGPPGKLRDLPGHAFTRAGTEAVNATRADDGGADTRGPPVEDDLVDIAVPCLVREVRHLIDVVEIIINMSRQLLAEAIGFPIEEDRGARGVDEVAWGGAGAEALDDCIRTFHVVIISGI